MKKSFDILLIIIVSTIFGGLFGSYLVVNQLGNLAWLKNGQTLTDINKEIINQQGQNKAELAVIDVVKLVSPSVVSVVIKKDVSTNYQIDPFFDFFNNWPFAPVQPEKPQDSEPDFQKVGGGTGFIISADGLILTNKHVVADTSAKYSVVLNDGKEYEAQVVGTDVFNDIGVLKIEAKNLPVVTLGDSDQLLNGQTVIAIGNALAEFSNTVTVGVVSGIGRNIVAGNGLGSSEKLEDVIQTDAAINPGNSGGPLLNLAGEVIGINTAVSSQGQLIGFAIPINSAKQVIASVKLNGEIIRPYLGVRYQMINPNLKQAKNLSLDNGALLLSGNQAGESAIMADSPAEKAGLKEGDIITEVNGRALDNDYDLAKAIATNKPGDIVTLKLWSAGESKELKVTLEKYKN